jgi:uncharacterized DUF497 family protein
MALAFDWDDGNREKCQKHGISIQQIEALLAGSPRIAPDLAHSRQEDRFIAVGQTIEGRHLLVAFTIRSVDGTRRIRPVSARYMHAKERQAYDQTGS